MPEIQPNGKNGTWNNWVLGIFSVLVVAAVVGTVTFQYEIGKTLGTHDTQLKNLLTRIDERTMSRFTREDFDREMRGRDLDRARLERRLELLEQRPK